MDNKEDYYMNSLKYFRQLNRVICWFIHLRSLCGECVINDWLFTYYQVNLWLSTFPGFGMLKVQAVYISFLSLQYATVLKSGNSSESTTRAADSIEILDAPAIIASSIRVRVTFTKINELITASYIPRDRPACDLWRPRNPPKYSSRHRSSRVDCIIHRLIRERHFSHKLILTTEL